jgi:hypothetical protein
MMEILTMKSSLLRSFNDASSDNAIFKFDLPALIGKMKLSNSWSEGELNAKILLKSPCKQILLTALHGGTEISSFQSNDSITLQIIEGRLRFHTRRESVTLEKDQILTLDEKIKYSLSSSVETVFLLTITQSSLCLSDN